MPTNTAYLRAIMAVQAARASAMTMSTARWCFSTIGLRTEPVRSHTRLPPRAGDEQQCSYRKQVYEPL